MSKKYTFPISPLCFWVKGSVEVGSKVTKVTTRNTVLGVIPAGSNKQTIPMSNVSTVQVRTGVLLGRIIWGVILTLIGLSLFSYGGGGVLFGVIIALIGIATVIAGLPVFLDIETAGATRTFYAPVYAKSTIEQIADDMNNQLAGVEDRRDVSAAADKIVGAINDKKTESTSSDDSAE